MNLFCSKCHEFFKSEDIICKERLADRETPFRYYHKRCVPKDAKIVWTGTAQKAIALLENNDSPNGHRQGGHRRVILPSHKRSKHIEDIADKIIDYYVNRSMPLALIGRMLDISTCGIRNLLMRHGVQLRSSKRGKAGR